MNVVIAGTFGPIHDGHRRLLAEALRAGEERVVACLTSDAFANEKRDRPVPAFQERKRALAEELDALDRWGREVDIRRIDDEYGVAIEDPRLDAIVVSEETEGRVEAINCRREARNMNPLEPIVVPMVSADDGERISSTRIVREEIDEHGSVDPG